MAKRKAAAGRHEQSRYDTGLKAWRGRMLPRLRWMLLPFFVLSVAFALLGPASKWQYTAGLVGGGAFVLYMWIRDDPPEFVTRHLRGAEGERATEKALEPLIREGWHAVHDVDIGRGNRDHVLVGPGGVYLLDSKNLGGQVSVADDVLQVDRSEDVRDSYSVPKLAGAVRGQAAALHAEIQAALKLNVWTSAVVVIWSPFEAGVIEGRRITFVHGSELAGWLRRKPTSLSETTIAKIAEHFGINPRGAVRRSDRAGIASVRARLRRVRARLLWPRV
jgi:hypothetical protein